MTDNTEKSKPTIFYAKHSEPKKTLVLINKNQLDGKISVKMMHFSLNRSVIVMTVLKLFKHAVIDQGLQKKVLLLN